MAEPWVPATGEHLPPRTDIDSLLLGDHLRDALWTAAMTSPRTLQVTLGASEIGGECDRQMAYRALGTPPVNHADPLRALVGLGVHLQLADMFRRLDGGSGRYLVEERVSYRGVPGTVDLFDRRRHAVIDWKSTTKAKIRRIARDGPPGKYVVQGQTYGAALEARGETVTHVAMCYVPVDSDLSDVVAFVFPYDRAKADAAIDRWEQVRETAATSGASGIQATPTRLCPWCSHYRPASSDLDTGCPGITVEEEPRR
jgi:PD-(D/E)XK nuclease superfamily